MQWARARKERQGIVQICLNLAACFGKGKRRRTGYQELTYNGCTYGNIFIYNQILHAHSSHKLILFDDYSANVCVARMSSYIEMNNAPPVDRERNQHAEHCKSNGRSNLWPFDAALKNTKLMAKG